MGIGVKDVGNFMRKVLEFSMNTNNEFLRNHAVFPGFVMFLFILCISLPSVFFFLLYSSPILVFLGLYLWNSSKMGDSKLDISSRERNNENEASLSVSSNNSQKDLRPQKSVRRNARRNVEEVGKDWDSQASEEEKDKVILTSIYNELLGRKSPPSFEDSNEIAFPSERESLFDDTIEGSSCRPKNLVTDPSEKLASDWGETTKSESSEEDEDDDQERGNKAVEWNADDEKNLMDLGFSEIERNKRLEVLIARRRARKLFLLAAEKSLMDMEIPSICVGRNYFDLENTYGFDGLQMPGSAPSMLSPSRNPFDLPYEPHEERLNLTGDSFDQEFSVANQKDFFFCRHESFCCGHFPVGYIQDSKLGSHSEFQRKPIDRLRRSRFSTQFDKEENDDHPAQTQELFCEKHHLAKEKSQETEIRNDVKEEAEYYSPKSEVRNETDRHCTREEDSDSDHSSSKESEKDFITRNQKEASKADNQTDDKQKYQLEIRDQIRNSSTSIGVPRSSASSSLGNERQKYMEYFGYNTNRGRHRVTMSMDSDLHVEVSDIGSPPTSLGGNYSSDDEKTFSFYESDSGKEMDFHGEETEPKPRDANNDSEFISSGNEAESNSNSEKRVDMTAVPLVIQPQEVNSQTESQELPPKPADEIKISYGLDEQEQAPEIDLEHDQDNYKEQNRNRLPAAEISEISAKPTKPALEMESRADFDSNPETSVRNAA